MSETLHEIRVVKDLLQKLTFTPGENAYAVSCSWFNQWKDSLSEEDDGESHPKLPEIDNSQIVNYFEKIQDVDYVVVPLSIWNVLLTTYGGGPAVEVDVGYDPKTKKGVPVTKLHSFKVHYQARVEKIMISKFSKVTQLIEAACARFDIKDATGYRLRDFWQHKPGRFLFPNQIICEYSLFVNTDLLLEPGDYPEENENSESTNSQNTTASNSMLSFPPTRATFNTQMVLTKPEFKNGIRRDSQQYRLRDPNKPSSLERAKPFPSMMPALQPNKEAFPSFKSRDNSQSAESMPNPVSPLEVTFERTSHPRIQLGTPNTGFDSRVSCPAIRPRNDDSTTVHVPGLRGITNIGNSCYMSSVLQCLLHLKPLHDIILEESSHLIAPTSKPMTENMQVFADFYRLYYNEVKVGPMNPSDIKNLVERSCQSFHGFMQQDAHEFLTIFLEILNQPYEKKKPSSFSLKDSSKSDTERADEEWEQHLKESPNSIITDIFHGQTRSSTLCPNCKSELVQFSPFTSILLQLPAPKTLSAPFIYVPLDPRQPRASMRIPLTNPTPDAISFTEDLSRFLNKQLSCAFGTQSSDFSVDWVPGPEAGLRSNNLVVYELTRDDQLFASVKLAVNTNKMVSQKVVEGPFLVPIPGPTCKSEDVRVCCEDYFKYLWEVGDSTFIPPALTNILPSIRPAKKQSGIPQKIIVDVAKSLFSKTKKFYPASNSKRIAGRAVTAVIAETEGVSWPRVVRNIVNNQSAAQTREVDIQTLIDDAARPTEHNETWKCTKCGETVTPRKATKIHRLPKVLCFALKRFDSVNGNSRKNNILVNYPDNLEISDITGKHTYELAAVIEHGGRMASGHYTAHAKLHDGVWAEFNDLQVMRCSSSLVAHHQNAYILFYTKTSD